MKVSLYLGRRKHSKGRICAFQSFWCPDQASLKQTTPNPKILYQSSPRGSQVNKFIRKIRS